MTVVVSGDAHEERSSVELHGEIHFVFMFIDNMKVSLFPKPVFLKWGYEYP